MSGSIILYFQEHANSFLDLLMQGITMAGEQMVFIAVITFIIWNISKRSGYMLTYTLMTSSILNGLLKLIVHSPRPFQVLEGIEGKRLSTAEGYSFPSGHTQGAVTFYTGVALCLKKRRYMAAAVIIAGLVGLSRVYLGVHWPIDVIGGFTIGLLYTLVMFTLLERLIDDPIFRQRLNLITAGISAAGLLVLIPLASGDSVHYEQYHSLIKLLSITGGFTIASFFEERQVHYDTAGSLMIKLLRYVIGLAGALLIMYGFKLILPTHEISTVIRYAGAALWAFYLYPLIGIRIRMDSDGTTLFTVLTPPND